MSKRPFGAPPRMSKIVAGLDEVVAIARCKPHQFKYLKGHQEQGVVGLCTNCKGRFTAWPGTIYYDEIVAAKGAFKGREG
jgi:hypothetical protein